MKKLKFSSITIFIISMFFLTIIGCAGGSDSGSSATAKTDTESVSLDTDELDITFGVSDDINNITQNIILPTTGTNGTTITWVSSVPAVISIGGEVVRPIYTASDLTVTLTATIAKNGISETKLFTVNVLKVPGTDAEAVADDTAALVISYGTGDDENNVTQNITLPTTGSSGTTITWVTSNSAVTIGGVVTRPLYNLSDATGNLTATITKGGSSSPKVFALTVKKNEPTDAEAVADDTAALIIGYGSGDSAGNVTQNITLSVSGSSGTTIAWAVTSGTGVAIAGTTGTVTRPAYPLGNSSVTLRATISKGITDTKDFTLAIISPAGTVADPYQIYTLAQLVSMRDNVNGAVIGANAKAYKLMADIDLATINTGIGWVPIGIATTTFTGTFNGNGKTISNLFINEPTADYKGLFGSSGGIIKDLTLASVNVTGNQYTAGLAGQSNGGSITNCSVTSGNVSGAGYATGGLAGYLTTSTITNCSTSVAVISRSGNSAGGLVGSNMYHGRINNSHTTGPVTGSSSNSLGGLVGFNSNYSPLYNCYATGSVTGDTKIGGLVGNLSIMANVASGLTDCYATGAVTSTSGNAGGLTGYISASTGTNSITLANCYATGAVTTAAATKGGLMGALSGTKLTVTNCFYDTNTTGMTAANANYGTATTTANMKLSATFTSWNFTTIWNIGTGYPYLR